MSVGPVGRKTLKVAREKQQELKTTQRHHPMVNAIANLEAPLHGGGPSLEDHLTGMQHPELDAPLFRSVDKVGQNCNVVIFAVDTKHMKLAKDLLDRLFLFLEARFGATVEQAFTDTFMPQQRQDFST